MQFKNISANEIPLINEFFTCQPYSTCDFTLLGLYMWISHFNYEYAFENGTLFIREHTETGEKYLIPLSKTLTAIDSIRYLIDNCDTCSDRIVLTAVPEILISDIENNFASDAVLTRDWSDYIYCAQDMLSLKGKKYSKKRNLIHQFLNSYKCDVKPIQKENIGEILNFVQEFSNSEELSALARYENNETIDVLNNYDKFSGLYGFVYYVDGKIIGFSVCECHNDICFIQIEKALKDYKGAYQFIFWRTVNEIFKEQPFQYVNREEDVGDVDLRKAKMSYYPLKLLNKYEVTINIGNH